MIRDLVSRTNQGTFCLVDVACSYATHGMTEQRLDSRHCKSEVSSAEPHVSTRGSGPDFYKELIEAAFARPLALRRVAIRLAGADQLFGSYPSRADCCQAFRNWTTLFAFRPVIASSMCRAIRSAAASNAESIL